MQESLEARGDAAVIKKYYDKKEIESRVERKSQRNNNNNNNWKKQNVGETRASNEYNIRGEN